MTLFGTAGIRGPVAERVTPDLALAVGRAVGTDASTLVVGRDGRETGGALAAAVEAGATSVGATVERIGQVPTPTLAYASQGCHGVMLTASHNPPQDNGIKLFVDGVACDGDTEARIEQRIETGVDSAPWGEWTDATDRHILEEYQEAVTQFAERHGTDLDGMGVVVDCGNGMGAKATPQVLRMLGATIKACNANVDGHFTARPSKPTPETLEDLCAFVESDPDAAMGIGHDGDADRIVVVDTDGEIVHEDTILAILAEHYVRDSDAADPVVVTPPNASGRIDERVEVAGGRVERVALGSLHEGMAAVRRSGDSETEVAFAAEPWKPIHPRFGGWIDGVLSAAVLARLVADRGLDDLRAPVTERPYRKGNVECPDEHKQETMARVETALPERFPEASVSLDHGVRLAFDDGSWALVRPSGTEPYVRVYAESDDVATLTDAVTDLVAEAVS